MILYLGGVSLPRYKLIYSLRNLALRNRCAYHRKEVSTLQNDETTALNERAEVNSQDTTPVSEQTPGEVADVSTQSEPSSEEVVDNQPTETGGESKKGYSNRVRELANENRSLKQRLEEITGTGYDPAPYIPQVVPGQEVSPEQYRQDVSRTADALVNLRIKQNEAVNRINNESAEVIRAFPELDPESDKFNKDLSESISEATEAFVRQNPYSASVKQFVTKLMKPYKGAVAKEVGQAQENLAKQVSQSALKPTSVHKQDKSPEEMTTKELEARLGVVQA